MTQALVRQSPRSASASPSAAGDWPRHRVPLLRLLRRGVGPLLLRELEEAKARCGDYVDFRVIGPFRMYLVSDPAGVEEVLVGKWRSFVRGEPEWTNVRRAVGDGLITSDGELHRRQRALIQPVFNPRRVRGHSETMLAAAEAWRRRWEDRAGDVVDVHLEMMHLTMSVIARVLFGEDLKEDPSKLSDAVTELNSAALRFDASLFGLLPWMPNRANRRFHAARRYLDGVFAGTLADRRRDPRQRPDVLSLLLRAQTGGTPGDASTSWMSDRQIRDEIVTLFGAGHETTATLLTFAWYALARHPEVEARLHAELDAVLGGRPPTWDDLPQLVYTEQVLRETMRLYPPVWGNQRVAVEEVEICGRRVPKGGTVGPLPWLVHRDERWYPDPMRFDPQRFTPEAVRARPRFAYFPFGGGDRQCVGQAFAEVEGQLLLAALAQHFAPRCAPGTRLEIEPMVSLRPRGGMPMRLVARD